MEFSSKCPFAKVTYERVRVTQVKRTLEDWYIPEASIPPTAEGLYINCGECGLEKPPVVSSMINLPGISNHQILQTSADISIESNCPELRKLRGDKYE
jgi:hypothetical protein